MQAHGTVLSCRVLYDHNSRSKQVAFVQMETHQQALKSIEALHSTQVERFPLALISQPWRIARFPLTRTAFIFMSSPGLAL